MNEKLKETTKEEVGKLPQEIQDAVGSLEWATIAEEIGRKYLLDEIETSNFQLETLLVLVNKENLDSYAKNIENEVGTSKEEGEKIANEAVLKIFTPIVNILTEKVKNSIANKDPDWKQSLNFILSGGDYSAFVKYENDDEVEKVIIPVFPYK